jgi:nitrite reductase/ring-hydroxylating ferredoxin subunit/Fe-S cluster biogenesis protein NfuA
MVTEPQHITDSPRPVEPDRPAADTETEMTGRLAEAAARLVDLTTTLGEHPDVAVGDQVAELLRAVDVLHRAGLRRLGGLLRKAGLERRALEDPEVALLFELYELTDEGERARAEAVLAEVRPYIESHGGMLTVTAAEWGEVTVRLSGACAGCQGSTATLRHVVEGALRQGLPDFERLVVEPPPRGHSHEAAPPGFVPLASIGGRSPRLSWVRACATHDVPAGTVRGIDMHGVPVLIANVDGDRYGYEDRCAGTPLPVAGGVVDGETLVCPWHGCRYDLRTGRRDDEDAQHLGVLPIAVVGEEIRIGMLEGSPA